MNEVELPEIGGTKAMLRPTLDERMGLTQLFLEQQKEKKLDLILIKGKLTDLLYNSLFLWENGSRTTKKEIGEEDVTKEDIESYVVKNIFELWIEVLQALDMIDKAKLQEYVEQQKKEVAEVKPNPN